jgi:hypothetical protein
MVYELPKRTKEDFPIPEKIISLTVDKVSGYPAHDGFESKTEYFIDGTQPNGSDPIHVKLKVCKGQEGLATPDDVARGEYDEKEYFIFKEDDPVSTDGRNRWQEGIDSWLSGQGDTDKYNPSTDYCHSGGMVNVGIDSPAHETTVGSTFDVKINTNSVKKIVEVKLWVDGVEKKVWNERPFEMSMSLSDGPHTLKVKATDRDGDSQERESKIGVNTAWNASPTPIVTVTSTVAPSPTLGL